MSAQDCSNRSWASTCWTHSRSATSTGSTRGPVTPKASASECAASVESTSVRRPAAAASAAVPAATVDLPTPPLPVKRRMRKSRPASGDRLDALLQPLERGVDQDLLALALQHPDQGDRDVEGEAVGHLGRAAAELAQLVGTVEGAQHLALHQGPGDLPVTVPLVGERVLVLDRA